MPDQIGSLAAMDGYSPEEADFQFGVRATPWFNEFTQQHGEPNLNDPNYDYRAAWTAGARPNVRDPGDNQLHWSSQFKGPEHPNRFVNGVDTITGQPVSTGEEYAGLGGDPSHLATTIKNWWTNQPSWLQKAQAENQKTSEAFQRGGMGEIASQLATDTTEAQDLASGFGGNIKGVKPPVVPGALAAISEYRPPFYSAVEQAVQGAKQNAAPGQQWAGFLRNQPGVKPEEVEALKLGKLFEQPGSVPKEAVLGEIAANRVNVKEIVKGGEPLQYEKERYQKLMAKDHMTEAELDELDRLAGILEGAESSVPSTKFSQYTLPGGENYREMLLTLPERKGGFGFVSKYDPENEVWSIVGRDGTVKETGFHSQYAADKAIAGDAGIPQDITGGAPIRDNQFRSSHYDEPNILAHVRYNDRVIDGKKTLFVEEVQSDWHQKGKREGYRSGRPVADIDRDIEDLYNQLTPQKPNFSDHPELLKRFTALHEERSNTQTAVPDAPFKTTWPELAMKRIIREAAEKGYDKVAWTPGSVQADRYDLSRHIEKVRAVKNDDGTFQLVATPKNGTAIMLGGGRLPADEMADHIGKDLAEKIVKDIEAKSGNNWGVKNKQSGNWSQRFASKEEAEAFQQSLPETTRKQTDVLAMAPKYSTEYSGLDLKVGGEGMKGFYDEILPATVNRLVKKHGGRVQEGSFATNNEGWHITPPDQTVHGRWMVKSRDYNSRGLQFDTEAEARTALAEKMKQNQAHTIDITPSLRAQAMKGFPLFTAGGVAATGAIGELARQDEYR